jgi:hypothetical protein
MLEVLEYDKTRIRELGCGDRYRRGAAIEGRSVAR